jgi:CubicO group peptidase (beta-lactamase class C family)
MEPNAIDANVGAFSGAGGHGTYFWADPQADLMGLLMLQLNPLPSALQDAFRRATYRAIRP